MLGKWYDGIVRKIVDETPNVKRFYVEIPTEEAIDFKPGQFATFDLPIHEKRTKRWRSYSIASGPDGSNVLEFVIVRLEGGLGTKYLFEEVNVGSELKLREPKGVFTLPETIDEELCLICTGTGIAPFRSMLLDIHRRMLKTPPIHLIFGTRTLEDVLYFEEMTRLAVEMPQLYYYVTLSRDLPDDWRGYDGYVHEIYERVFQDRRPAKFYLCGWKNMIDEARDRLGQMEYEKKQIIYEIYG